MEKLKVDTNQALNYKLKIFKKNIRIKKKLLPNLEDSKFTMKLINQIYK